MKRLFIVLMALAVLVALAVPAGAGKGGIPGKPSSAPLDIAISADLWRVNIAGDTIEYEITVTNRSGGPLDSIHLQQYVEATLLLDVTFDLPADDPQTPENEGEKPLPSTYYTVTADDLPSTYYTDKTADVEELVSTVEATDGGWTVTATAAVDVWNVEACDPEAGPVTTEGPIPCAWTASQSGFWTLTAKALPGKNPKKPSQMLVTMRDHFPGNWCVVPEGYEDWTPSGVHFDTLRPGESVKVYVYFPPDGICLSGGAGGEIMPVGSPGVYFLLAGGVEVTAEPGLIP